MTEGGRVQQESAAPPSTLEPCTPRKHRGARTRVAGWWCEYPELGTRRKQVPSASLFPQKYWGVNKTESGKMAAGGTDFTRQKT